MDSTLYVYLITILYRRGENYEENLSPLLLFLRIHHELTFIMFTSGHVWLMSHGHVPFIVVHAKDTGTPGFVPLEAHLLRLPHEVSDMPDRLLDFFYLKL